MSKLLFFLFPVILFAQSYMISNIPLPKSYVQNLDPYECDERCIGEFLARDMIFSFLAHAQQKLEDKELDEMRRIHVTLLNIGAFNPTAELKIALLLPYKKIGKYASSTTNAAFAYMMTKSQSFTLKSYKIEDEESAELQRALKEIEDDGFSYVVAPLTLQGAQNIVALEPQLNIYFPTIHKSDLETSSPYLMFGGIDYKAQSSLLLKEAQTPLVIFSDKSVTGQKLALFQEETFLQEPILEESELEEQKVIKYFVSARTTNLEHYLKENEDILNGSFFINTPIIKSGMIMSQLTLYETNATNLLSTQINYDPLLLSMTQYNDRKNMVIANSITEPNNILIETNSLLGNDIVYDWINYTTTVGIDAIYNEITGEEREYPIERDNGQMLYDIELLRPSLSRFIKYYTPLKERIE